MMVSKKLLSVIFAFVLSANFISGCSKTEPTSVTKLSENITGTSSVETSTSAIDTTVLTEQTTITTETSIQTHEKIGYSMHYMGQASSFHENKAWVLLGDAGLDVSLTDELAVINKHCDIIKKYSISELKNLLGVREDLYQCNVTSFSGGYSTIFFSTWNHFDLSENDDNDIQRTINEFLIVDESGEISFNSDDGDETTSYTFIAQYRDKFLIIRDKSTFSEANRSFVLIDGKGNVLVDNVDFGYDPKACGFFPAYTDSICLGNNLYSIYSIYGNDACFYRDMIFNYSTNEFINLHDYSIYYICKDGVLIVANTNGFGEILPSDLTSQNKLDEAISLGIEIKLIDSDYRMNYCDGVVYSWKRYAFYDKYGNELDILKNIPDTVSFSSSTRFENGYAFIKLTGADKKTYYCHIDKHGDFLYEPVLVEDNPFSESYEKPCFYNNGYVFNMDYQIFTPDGRVLEQPTDEKDKENIEKLVFYYENSKTGFYKVNGFPLMSEGYAIFCRGDKKNALSEHAQISYFDYADGVEYGTAEFEI